jgi:hypothetical protein
MFKIASTLIITLLSSPADTMTFEPGSGPCSALGDGIMAEAAEALGMCSSDYCCTRCNKGGTICDGCISGSKCDGHVFSCVGCYSGDSHCAIGTSGGNSCCD